jgi:hypothetical protein
MILNRATGILSPTGTGISLFDQTELSVSLFENAWSFPSATPQGKITLSLLHRLLFLTNE